MSSEKIEHNAFDELISILEDERFFEKDEYGDYDISAADGDSVIVLASMCSERLSDRFLEVLKELKDAVTDASGPEISVFFQRLRRIIQLSEKYPTTPRSYSMVKQDPVFSLEGEDFERVLKLSGDMRKIIFSSGVFDDAHKIRLLNRVSAIETELHKDKGRLDVVLAGVVDVGDALGKFGEKVEPLVKRMKELAEIARRGSRQYDQLPSPDEIKKLPPPNIEEE